ncbi:MAG: Hsp33 family molecular chaperone HslO [Fusobacteriaceae bacterium]
MDKIIRGISQNARFFMTDTTETVREANEIHKCTPGAISALGRFITAGVIMGSTLKGEDVLTLRTDTDGPVGKMLLTTDSKGHVKCYMQNPGATLPENHEGGYKVQDFVGKGTLNVIKDMGLKEPYVGISEINYGDIAQDITYYYFTSEQVLSVLSLGVSFDKEGNIDYAGGYMIQLLPFAEENFISKLEAKVSAMRSFTELRKGGMDLERIIKLIYDDMEDENPEKLIEEYSILEEKEVKYVCNCSRDKFLDKVVTLGQKEIEEIIIEEGALNVECHFCGKHYSFKTEDFQEVYETQKKEAFNS